MANKLIENFDSSEERYKIQRELFGYIDHLVNNKLIKSEFIQHYIQRKLINTFRCNKLPTLFELLDKIVDDIRIEIVNDKEVFITDDINTYRITRNEFDNFSILTKNIYGKFVTFPSDSYYVNLEFIVDEIISQYKNG